MKKSAKHTFRLTFIIASLLFISTLRSALIPATLINDAPASLSTTLSSATLAEKDKAVTQVTALKT
jgi:hypothetical protein